MTIEYLPNGVACDLSCKYCYQDPMRGAGNITSPMHFMDVKAALLKQGAPFAVFGGEALLTPKPKLKEIWAFGLKHFKTNSIQTNALSLDDDHIAMFKEYKVGVGISIDGWGELNRARSSPAETNKIINNIKKLRRAEIIPSIIITIHRVNANKDLLNFIYWLKNLGVTHVNLHILEVDSPKVQKELALTNEENFHIFKMIYDEFKETSLYISPFADIKELLTKTDPKVNCVWNACDATNTGAVQGVAPDGSLINCGRTNKDGINWLKADSTGKERYLALYHTPTEYGGCKDCVFFYACKGQCPGTAMDGDWRNKTSHCQFWYDMINYIWKDILFSSSAFSKPQMREMGAEFIRSLGQRQDNAHLDTPHGDAHEDHTDTTPIVEVTWID